MQMENMLFILNQSVTVVYAFNSCLYLYSTFKGIWEGLKFYSLDN